MRRRYLVIPAAIVLVPVVVLGVELQMARSATRLDDEIGTRPERLEVRPGPDPSHVVWLGDSTTTGVGADDFTDSMAYRVAAGLTDGPVELTVLGRSGDQVHEVLEDQLPRVADAEPDVVLISIGANDVTALTRQPTFEDRYRRLVAGVLEAAPQTRVIAVGIPDIGTAPRIPVPLRQIAGFRGSQLDDEIEEIARTAGERIAYVDLAGPTSPIFSSDPDRYFAADDFHPSSAGHRVWADAVLDALNRDGNR